MESDNNSEEIEITEYHAGQRLDKVLADSFGDISRSRLKALIQQGQVKLDQVVVETPSLKVKEGQVIELQVPELEEYEVNPENIPIDVVYEDNDLLVINKAVDMVVHPGAGNWTGTLVHALLHHCGDSLSGIGGVMRPGIVHRLDKETSGLMMVAKNDRAHQHLSEQLADRSLSRTYVALVVGQVQPAIGTIDQPIGRHPRDRVRMAIRNQGGKEAVTNYKVLEYFGEALSLVECKLQTGRTHQIRVHMEGIKHPLIGDPLYGEQPTRIRALMKKAGYEKAVYEPCISFPRQALHAAAIAFIHPRTDRLVEFQVNIPNDLQEIINSLK